MHDKQANCGPIAAKNQLRRRGKNVSISSCDISITRRRIDQLRGEEEIVQAIEKGALHTHILSTHLVQKKEP